MEFELNGQVVDIGHLPPTTTLLQFLRVHRRLCGTKEVCAEGDCGACTVILLDPDALGGPALRAVNSCLILLPMVSGRRVWTVEGLADSGLHPAQQAMVDELGSQCGYCTPGIVMSIAEAAHRDDLDSDWKLEDQLCGNLCRCTGYRPIRDAARKVAATHPDDALARALKEPGASLGAAWAEEASGAYRRPKTLEGVFSAFVDLDSPRVVCGATDLGLDVTKRRNDWTDVIDLSAVEELRGIRPIDGGWSIGATVRLSDLERWAETELPPVARMLRFFGARQIKHMGSIGGNLCNASPIGDLAPILLALGATAVIAGPEGERRVALSDFFVAYRKTALGDSEILAAIEVPEVPDDARVVAYKVSKRRELDISAVACGLYVRVSDGTVTEARFGFGGMAATPSRAANAEEAVVGQPWSQATLDRAAAALSTDFSPIDDHRGTAWYRSTVAANLVRAFFAETSTERMPALPDYPSGTVVEVTS